MKNQSMNFPGSVVVYYRTRKPLKFDVISEWGHIMYTRVCVCMCVCVHVCLFITNFVQS